MPDISPFAWVSVASAIGGAILTLLTGAILDALKERRTRQRERESSTQSTQAADRDRQIRFQRQTLVDLQKGVEELGRTAAMMAVANTRSYEQTGEWRANYGTELNERARLSLARTSHLGARVADEEIRRLLNDMQHWWWGVPLAGTRAESEAAFAKVQKVGKSLNERIGALLRQADVGTLNT